MFSFPEKARFGRVLPKSKVFEKAKPSSALRNRFVAEVEKITWQFKLSPETVNLPEGQGVQEIEVFSVALKTSKLGLEVLRCLDQAIGLPIFFELSHGERVRLVSAYKRAHETAVGKWVVDDYFESPWQPVSAGRSLLPLALDMGGLYEGMMRALMPAPLSGESLRAQVERLARLRMKQGELKKLEAKVQREKQFNRKVDLNRSLRELKKEVQALQG